MCFKFPIYVIITIKYFCTLWEFLIMHLCTYVCDWCAYSGAMAFNMYSGTPHLRFLCWAVDFNIKLNKILKWRKFITTITDLALLKLEVQQGKSHKLRNIKWRLHCILYSYVILDYFGGICTGSVINFLAWVIFFLTWVLKDKLKLSQLC
jgi:hypothetical protein